jgi:hypothetical protein
MGEPMSAEGAPPTTPRSSPLMRNLLLVASYLAVLTLIAAGYR